MESSPDEQKERTKKIAQMHLKDALRDVEMAYTKDPEGSLKNVIGYLGINALRENPRIQIVVRDLMKVILTDAVFYLKTRTKVGDIRHDVGQRTDEYTESSFDLTRSLLEEEWHALAKELIAMDKSLLEAQKNSDYNRTEETSLYKTAVEKARTYATNAKLLTPEERDEILSRAKQTISEELDLLQ